MVTRVRQAALGQAVNEYLDILSAGGRARTTLELYRGLLRRFAQAVGEDRSVGELSTADATAHLAALRERSSSGAYPTTVTRVLKGFFTWLTETGQIEVNPMASITATCGLNASIRAHYTGSFAASGSGQGCQGPSLMRFLAQTGNALALQALLGHTSLIMVQRYIAAAQGEIALEAHRQHSPLDALL